MLEPLTPIFTGGTGRSGTTVLGSLLGHHSQVWATLPREIRFLTDHYGLLDLAIGGTSASRLPNWYLQRKFLKKLHNEWWDRIGPDGSERGLHRGVLPSEFAAAVKQFQGDSAGLPARSQGLVHNMLDPAARRNGANIWVETTPANAMNADRLLALLPKAFVIHVVRDGRDACASVVKRAWGPKDHLAALEWWRSRMLLSHESMKVAPKDRTLTILLDDLLVGSREEHYKDLLRFLGLDDEEEMRSFFFTSMTSDRGHVGRWKDEVPAALRDRFSMRYAEIWHELNEAQVPLAPLD